MVSSPKWAICGLTFMVELTGSTTGELERPKSSDPSFRCPSLLQSIPAVPLQKLAVVRCSTAQHQLCEHPHKAQTHRHTHTHRLLAGWLAQYVCAVVCAHLWPQWKAQLNRINAWLYVVGLPPSATTHTHTHTHTGPSWGPSTYSSPKRATSQLIGQLVLLPGQ